MWPSASRVRFNSFSLSTKKASICSVKAVSTRRFRADAATVRQRLQVCCGVQRLHCETTPAVLHAREQK